MQRPTNSMPFRQIIIYILQFPRDIHVHLFFLDLHKFNLFLLRSRAATCPTSNCWRGTSLLRQELVLIIRIQLFLFVNYVIPVAMPSSDTKYNYLIQFESLLSDIVNIQDQLEHKLRNCSKYNLMKKQQHPNIPINPLS